MSLQHRLMRRSSDVALASAGPSAGRSPSPRARASVVDISPNEAFRSEPPCPSLFGEHVRLSEAAQPAGSGRRLAGDSRNGTRSAFSQPAEASERRCQSAKDDTTPVKNPRRQRADPVSTFLRFRHADLLSGNVARRPVQRSPGRSRGDGSQRSVGEVQVCRRYSEKQRFQKRSPVVARGPRYEVCSSCLPCARSGPGRCHRPCVSVA